MKFSAYGGTFSREKDGTPVIGKNCDQFTDEFGLFAEALSGGKANGKR
jgi:hypothetical protein